VIAGFRFDGVCSLALIVMESPEFEKFIFPDRKERPAEAPFMALEKLLFQMRT